MRCLEKDDANKVLEKLHEGPSGVHFGRETTTHKVLRVGYYWPTLFEDVKAYARTCQVFQVNIGKEQRPVFPLQLVMV